MHCSLRFGQIQLRGSLSWAIHDVKLSCNGPGMDIGRQGSGLAAKYVMAEMAACFRSGVAAELPVCWKWFGSQNSSLFEACKGVAAALAAY